MQNEKAEIARLKCGENIRIKKLEEAVHELEERLAMKEREFHKYREEMRELEVAHRNLKSTWMNERKDPQPSTSPCTSRIASFKKNKSISSGRSSRTGISTLPLNKLSNTLGSGGFNSARGPLAKTEKTKNIKSVTQKVLPNSL